LNSSRKLLIAPEGIEMGHREREEEKSGELLIAPEGIEILERLLLILFLFFF